MNAIVVGTDGSQAAEKAVRQAAEIARREGASIHLVAAYRHGGVVRERLGDSARSEPVDLREVADGALARARGMVEEFGVPFELSAREGDPAEVLLDVTREQDAEMIVVGDKGSSGVGRFPLGSVAQKVSHHAPVSVMIVRGAGPSG